MAPISAPMDVLLGSDAVAPVWTNNRTGSPQVSVVWVIAEGDEILFGLDAKGQKARNLARDPRTILSSRSTSTTVAWPPLPLPFVFSGRAEVSSSWPRVASFNTANGSGSNRRVVARCRDHRQTSRGSHHRSGHRRERRRVANRSAVPEDPIRFSLNCPDSSERTDRRYRSTPRGSRRVDDRSQ